MPDPTAAPTMNEEADAAELRRPEEADAAEPQRPEEELVLDELLIEDVSIDGMCGVY